MRQHRNEHDSTGHRCATRRNRCRRCAHEWRPPQAQDGGRIAVIEQEWQHDEHDQQQPTHAHPALRHAMRAAQDEFARAWFDVQQGHAVLYHGLGERLGAAADGVQSDRL